MIICIDIGNTNITIGLYDGKIPQAQWRLASDYDRMPDEFGVQLINLLRFQNISHNQIQGGIIASVVPPLTNKWIQVCEMYLNIKPMIVDSSLTTGIHIAYDEPNSVGADRIVDAATAFHLYGGPLCIVDFGTATTFDALSEDGTYLGGAIAPGVMIAAEALFQRTAKLPRVDLAHPPSVIGRNTTHSMQSGILFGYVGLVEGMVARFKTELGPTMKVVATGGLAEVISKETPCIDIIAPWLTLDGLEYLYTMNTNN